jgi:hypothetical protein
MREAARDLNADRVPHIPVLIGHLLALLPAIGLTAPLELAVMPVRFWMRVPGLSSALTVTPWLCKWHKAGCPIMRHVCVSWQATFPNSILILTKDLME